jgi:hypothetical protein
MCTTQSVLVQDTKGIITTTTTKKTALMEAQFQGLETEMKNLKKHQIHMDQCLYHLKNCTVSINDNITAMMAHWQITPSKKHRTVSVMQNDPTQSLATYQQHEENFPEMLVLKTWTTGKCKNDGN